jgi:hypothetical protein
MKRGTLLALAAIAATPALADAPQTGQAAFAEGRGHIVLEAGYTGMSVDPVRGDGYIAIDGAPVTFAEGIDFIDGQFYGGELTYVLPGEDEPSWFGRNLRVFGSYEHQKARASERIDGNGPTIDDGFDVTSVSSDGRSFASSSNHLAYADAQTGFYAASPSVGLMCVDANGAVTASAFQDAGLGQTATCDALASTATAQSTVIGSGDVWNAIANASLLPGLPLTTVTVTRSHYDVTAKRGEAGIAGDRRQTEALVLSPSLSVSIGERRARFDTMELVANSLSSPDVVAARIVEGGANTTDAALNLGLRASYDAGGGFDVFGSLRGAVVRRKTEMSVQSFVAASIFGESTIAMTAPLSDAANLFVSRSDTIAAAQGTLELGAGYRFEPSIGTGPLRLSITGSLTYDSDVPTYGNMGTFGGPLSGPVAPGYIDYSAETAFSITGGITVELP